MSQFLQKLRRRSYSRSFLFKSLLWILVVGSLLALFGPRYELPEEIEIPNDAEIEYMMLNQPVGKQLRNPLVPVPLLMKGIAFERNSVNAETLMLWQRELHYSTRPKSEFRILHSFLQALIMDTRGPIDTLYKESPDLPFHNLSLGWFYLAEHQWRLAAEALTRELQFHNDTKLRQLIISAYLKEGDPQTIDWLFENPEFSPFFTLKQKLDYHTKAGHYLQLLLLLPQREWGNGTPRHLSISLLTGALWLLFLLNAAQAYFQAKGAKEILTRCSLYTASFFLGVLSVIPTLFLVYLTKEWYNPQLNGELFNDFSYYLIAASREEICKVIAFLPLVPILLKRAKPLEIFLCAALVGLGFAAEENITYVASADSFTAFSRFVTANVLHIGLTGLAGLAIAQSLHNLRQHPLHGLEVLILASLAHTIYNLSIGSNSTSNYTFVSYIVLLLILREFFRTLFHYREQNYGRQLSLTWQFSVMVTLLLVAALNLAAYHQGFTQAVGDLFLSFGTSGLMIVLFVKQFNETLAD